jgi:NADH-quinone oxidoreductase subunit N
VSTPITTSWVLALAPEISLIVLLVLVLIYDRVWQSEQRRVGLLTAWGGLATLAITLGLWFFFNEPNAQWSLSESVMWGGMIRHDLATLVFRVIFLVVLILVSLISVDVRRLQKGEFYALLIMATIGFNLMAASVDLIMLYVALETASVSSYVLAGFMSNNKRSSEAGMKYFVYGAFATSIMLYGMSLLYGLTGQTNLYIIGDMLRQVPFQVSVDSGLAVTFQANPEFHVILLAAVMIVVGFGFKISIVPFHFWAPDVYEGAPTSVTAFISTASKAAGFAVVLRVFLTGSLGQVSFANSWWSLLVVMAIVTMVLGNFAAIYQTSIKRLLAYSSIAQAGYVLIGLIVLTPEGAAASMFYLLMYVFTNIAAFGVIILVSNVTHSDRLSDLNGLSRRSPNLALVMLFALLSLGGIPPAAGFVGKFLIFKAAVDVGLWWLAMIGILNAFVALYYYLNVVKYMYLYPSAEETEAIPVSRAAAVGLGISTLIIILLGTVYAGPAYEWTLAAAASFFPG